jgi:hypothetical protein
MKYFIVWEQWEVPDVMESECATETGIIQGPVLVISELLRITNLWENVKRQVQKCQEPISLCFTLLRQIIESRGNGIEYTAQYVSLLSSF